MQARRTLRIPASSRDLPVPIDRFVMVDGQKVRSNESRTTEITLWVTLNSKFEPAAAAQLASQSGISGIRVNAGRYPDFTILANQMLAIQNALSSERVRMPLCIDTNGPKTRTTGFASLYPAGFVEIFAGDRVVLAPVGTTNGVQRPDVDNQKLLPLDSWLPRLEQGTLIFVSDGWLELRVNERAERGAVVTCTALNDSRMFEGRGVDVPGMYSVGECLTQEDLILLERLRAAGIVPDFVGLSFAQSSQDVHLLRDALRSLDLESKILAKIETAEAIDRVDEIVQSSDAIMIARGDLALQMAREQRDMLSVEFDLIERCRQGGKACVIATRVADSLEEGAASLDDYERYRLARELSIGGSLVLVLCNETSEPSTAVRNYRIVNETLRVLNV